MNDLLVTLILIGSTVAIAAVLAYLEISDLCEITSASWADEEWVQTILTSICNADTLIYNVSVLCAHGVKSCADLQTVIYSRQGYICNVRTEWHLLTGEVVHHVLNYH